jgi:hypothetical protein
MQLRPVSSVSNFFFPFFFFSCFFPFLVGRMDFSLAAQAPVQASWKELRLSQSRGQFVRRWMHY